MSVVRAVHELTRSESEGEHVCGPDVILTAKSEPQSGRFTGCEQVGRRPFLLAAISPLPTVIEANFDGRLTRLI